FEPFKGKTGVKELIEKLDHDAIAEIEAGRGKGFVEYIDRTGATICGHEPIAIVMEMFPDTKGKLLHYSSSAETTGGDYSDCVQYASIVLFRSRKEAGLTEEERKTLIAIARDTLRAELGGKGLPDGSAYSLTPLLKEHRGVFVTLKNRGELRGCVGYMEGIKPLWQAVSENAVNASHDMRFLDNPITAKEEKDISIEISVLSPRTKVDRAEDITIGVHGVEIQKSGRRAVFLPQVAPEQGWDRETMLQHLCQKAGLRRDDWKTGATFLVFTAEVFGEEEHK
ncbi:MAG: AmmeMemoRadiSam system protein A, partial [Planctomycetota bacterium]|nr:AmmeMemoRadiSam system protein A [Planctomycetota bacterium]